MRPSALRLPVTMRVGNHSYVASAVHVDLITQPPGVTPIDIVTTRLDGVNMRFTAALGGMTLGNLPPETSRYATWYFRPTTPGPKTFVIRASSENGGEIMPTKDGAGRLRHEPGTDRDGDEPVGAASDRRGGVLGHRHGAEHGDGAVRILDDALLPITRRDQERR